MATYRFQMRFQGVSQLSEDVYENVLYFDCANDAGEFSDIATAVVAGYDTWGHHDGVDGAEVRVYALAGGQPIYQESFTYSFTSFTGPGEVAICLSYAQAATWDTTTARRRGRIFLGPLSGGDVAQARPSSTLIGDTITLGQAIRAAGLLGSGLGWQIYSPTDAVSSLIETISVDDAWDTQRRRGLAPTARTVFSF